MIKSNKVKRKQSEYLQKQKGMIEKDHVITSELYSFYMDIYNAQEDFSEKTGEIIVASGVISDTPPFLKVMKGIIGEEVRPYLNSLIGRISEIVTEHNPGMDLTLFSDKFHEDIDDVLSLLLNHDFGSLEKKAVEFKLHSNEFMFLVHNICKPLMVIIREKADKSASREDWLEKLCPFCGFFPDVSKIVEAKENTRFLHCSLCENEWEFPRVKCPSCGSEDQGRIGFFEHEENPGLRAYYCDECGYYIKCLKVTKSFEESGFDLSVEDKLTSFIDSTMISKGYKRI